MRPLRGAVWGCALVLLGAGATSVRAAWCNVFQVCCHGAQPSASASFYAPANPCCDPCPQPVCTTRYVQRCYYQPVTCYQTRTYYEPVTTYRTSYYYEPVVSYRYSCYYDPCTCRYQQVACPTTSYRLRSQCCPVQSWVQRCCTVPVTTYQQASYWEPVTTCCTPPPCPPPCPPVAAPEGAPAAAAGVYTQTPAPAYVPQATSPPPAGVTEPRSPAPPAVQEYPPRNGSEAQPYPRYYPPAGDYMPPAAGSSYRQLLPRTSVPAQPAVPPSPPPSVKLDRITSAPAGQIQGQVVRADDTPLAGVRVLFVSADRREPRRAADTDAAGRFQVTLTSGGWLVYVQGLDGKPIFHRKIEVRQNETSQVYLVSRAN